MYAGIDIGTKGAMAYTTPSGIEVIDFSSKGLKGYIDILTQNDDLKLVGVEQVHSMPKQGVKSMFSFGQRLGEVEGMLQALKIPYILIPPMEWQRKLNIKAKSDKKEIAKVIAKLYPNVALNGPKGGLLDGRSDALGLLHYVKGINDFIRQNNR